MKVCDPDDDGLLIDSERLNPRYCSHLQNHIYLLGGFASNAVHESINIVDMFDSSSKVVLTESHFVTVLVAMETYAANESLPRTTRRGCSERNAVRAWWL